MPQVVRFWRWADVDPVQREFDPSLARMAAVDVMTDVLSGDLTRTMPPPGMERRQIEEQLETSLVAVFGAWISGWNWAASEPGSGGPVRAWCCDDHSVLRNDDGRRDIGALPTVERVVAATTEWRTFLEELGHIFAELRTATAHLGLADRTEHAAARLVAVVIERTEAEDAWYATFGTLLRWFLESCDVEVDQDALYAVMNGKFESWITPHATTIATTSHELGESVAATIAAPPVRDALVAWLKIRPTAFRVLPEVKRRPHVVDAHRTYIETTERQRDPRRADLMAKALEACRTSARNGEPLTFGRLASWQAIVLGERTTPTWRTTDASARHVRYAFSPDLPARLDVALAEANGHEPAAVRAARVYLDVAFFHPFADGNARAARLAFDHVLTRAGLGVAAIEPVILLQRAGDDYSGAYWLAHMIDQLAGPLP